MLDEQINTKVIKSGVTPDKHGVGHQKNREPLGPAKFCMAVPVRYRHGRLSRPPPWRGWNQTIGCQRRSHGARVFHPCSAFQFLVWPVGTEIPIVFLIILNECGCGKRCGAKAILAFDFGDAVALKAVSHSTRFEFSGHLVQHGLCINTKNDLQVVDSNHVNAPVVSTTLLLLTTERNDLPVAYGQQQHLSRRIPLINPGCLPETTSDFARGVPKFHAPTTPKQHLLPALQNEALPWQLSSWLWHPPSSIYFLPLTGLSTWSMLFKACLVPAIDIPLVPCCTDHSVCACVFPCHTWKHIQIFRKKQKETGMNPSIVILRTWLYSQQQYLCRMLIKSPPSSHGTNYVHTSSCGLKLGTGA